MGDGDRDGDLDGDRDGDRDGCLTSACLALGLSRYFDVCLLCRPCGGLFQNVWAPNSLAVFMFVDDSCCSKFSSLFLDQIEIVTYRW